MTNHIASIDDFKDFRQEIVLLQDPSTRKRISFILMTEINHMINTIELYNQIHVYDIFDKIVYTGNHLNLAIKTYNQL